MAKRTLYGNNHFIQLVQSCVTMKRAQQVYDLHCLTRLRKPLHLKWMQEIVTNQYKHEKMFKEIYTYYTNEVVQDEEVIVNPDTNNIASLIEKRMESMFENIELLTQMAQYSTNENIKYIINEMIQDEHIHGHKLCLIYSDINAR